MLDPESSRQRPDLVQLAAPGDIPLPNHYLKYHPLD